MPRATNDTTLHPGPARCARALGAFLNSRMQTLESPRV